MKWIAPHGATTPTERYVNAQPTIAGSNPDCAFFNTVLDELLAVIVAADMTPTDENLHQIADAIEYLTERAATSGVTKGSYWFGKTTANFTVPNPTLPEQNYIDFTTLNTYSAKSDLSGWTQTGTFVPPVGIDFTILITSKFWDIPEQDGQQGGWAQYNHTDDEWSWWPRIINLDNAANLSLSNLNSMGKNRFQKNLVSADGMALFPDFIQSANLGNNTWYSIAYDGTKFVALGNSGYISTSTDGENWTAAVQNANLGSNNWQSIAYDGTKFVALGNSGYISTSTDGENWTAAVQNADLGSSNWRALVYNGTKFVALGLSGGTSTSTDGENWNTINPNKNLKFNPNYWYRLAWDGKKFVAVGSYGYISTSTDGINWAFAVQNKNLPINDNWQSIAYDGTKFVVLSSKGYLSVSNENSEIIDMNDCVIEFHRPTSYNNYTWYRKYKSGWVEQGGQFTAQGGQYGVYQVTLPVTMADNNYYANGIAKYSSADNTFTVSIDSTKTTTTVLGIRKHWASTGQTIIWEAKGMAA